MLRQALRIIENMPQDENTMALKNIINSVLKSQRIYMLSYKGKPLRFYTQTNTGEFCNEVSYYLTLDQSYPIWTTTDVRIAAYNKYISTMWYNSEYDQTTHNGVMDPKDIQIMDNYGNVYNRKPLTIRTCHIIKHKIFGHQLNNELLNSSYYAGLYDNLYLLEEAKERYQRNRLKFDVGLQACSLSDLQNMRKQLVKEKGQKVSQGKPYKRIQNKLDKVNKAIRNLGGM